MCRGDWAISTTEAEITPTDRARLMGLCLTEGIAPARFAARTGLTLDSAIDSEILARALEEGYLIQTPARLAPTPEGRKHLDSPPAALVL